MPDYTYTARSISGQIQKGTINARSKESAIAALRGRQLHPIVIEEAKKGGLNMEISLPGNHRVKSKDLVIFTRQLATMVDAGVPLLRSLSLLRDQTESPILRKVLAAVIVDIQSGASLSVALAKRPEAFSDIYINMVRAGEAGGILDKVLERLAYQQEKDASLKSKIHGAMIYPLVIFAVAIIAFFILMTFIVPKIGLMLTELSNGKEQLPIYTQILLDLSHDMKTPAFILGVVVGLPLIIVLFKHYTKTEKGRYVWHSIILRIPSVRNIIVKSAVARFSRIFASLMSAGVSIVDAIETTANAIGNAVIEKELLNCSKAVESGASFADELAKQPHFPPIVVQMLAVGEETGKTEEIILKVADFYEEEVDVAVAGISSIIEPVMIILLGAMVGLIAVSVFGPITKAETSPSSIIVFTHMLTLF